MQATLFRVPLFRAAPALATCPPEQYSELILLVLLLVKPASRVDVPVIYLFTALSRCFDLQVRPA